ncbi:MAG TPA: monomeric [FeFe] hydrogenase [Prolixibacteraceae bacterium]|nr:monomeric [FeFe] hydrogenase [Prolixibacteraceae bacterium]
MIKHLQKTCFTTYIEPFFYEICTSGKNKRENIMVVENKAMQIRREIQKRIVNLIFNERLLDEIDRIPMAMRPRGSESFRCCVYRDRALIKQKIMAMLGFEVKTEDDELSPLSDFILQSYVKANSEREILHVVEDACHGCQQNNYIVTNMCRGCEGRPCEVNCPKDAIDIIGRRAVINPDKCVSCGICESVCPYHSIIYAPVPCEQACPVGAISKNENGKEIIDFDKCTFCGKCLTACPFGAIVEETHLFDLAFTLKRRKSLTALLAPSVAASFDCSLPQIKNVLLQVGFENVVFVAEGAEQTAAHEAKEFIEQGENLLTTSCCPSFVKIIKKHVPELAEHVSSTPSPMVYAARTAKKRYPNAQTVFIGPCMAKKAESFNVSEVDMVINFEELAALLLALDIDFVNINNEASKIEAGTDAWGFAMSGGVLGAVKNKLPQAANIKPLVINGIDKKAIKQLKLVKKQSQFNFIEGMSCEGGCLGGCYMNVKTVIAQKRMNKTIEAIKQSESQKIEISDI